VLADARQLVPEIIPRSSVVYNGLSLPDVPPAPLPFDPPLLLCLGRVVEDKGFDVALKAFALLVDGFPRTRLLIAGDGPARPALARQAADLGLADVVEFTGWVVPEKVPELMNRATVVVIPSRWREAFSLVALQAAQMQRPVVATRVGGLPEVVVHQQTGLLVEKEDARALAKALAYLLAQPRVAMEMGQAGRYRAQEVFSWDRHINTYDTLYKTVILNN
jgi:glycogen(starch) synthase